MASQIGFWEYYERFRETVDLVALAIDPAIFTGVRDVTPRRSFDPFTDVPELAAEMPLPPPPGGQDAPMWDLDPGREE